MARIEAFATVLPSTMVASRCCGSLNSRASNPPEIGHLSASWRTCHFPSENKADSASAKKKLMPAKTNTPTPARYGISIVHQHYGTPPEAANTKRRKTKHYAPSTKHQAPEKHQASNPKAAGWLLNLELGAWSFSGAWCLVLGAWPFALAITTVTLSVRITFKGFLIEMTQFLHLRPPFARFAVRQRLLAWISKLPPFLGDRVGGHRFHIFFVIIADVFEIHEQVILPVGQLAKKNSEVADIALADHGVDALPDTRMKALVLFELLSLDADHLSVTFHCS